MPACLMLGELQRRHAMCLRDLDLTLPWYLIVVRGEACRVAKTAIDAHRLSCAICGRASVQTDMATYSAVAAMPRPL